MESCHRVSPGGHGILKTQSTAPFLVWGGRCVVFCGPGASAVFSTEKREGRPAAGPWRCGMHHPSRAAVPDAARIMPFGRPAAPRRDSLRPADKQRKSRPAFSPWERRWQPQTSCPDKIGGIIPGNLHRISHPFHFGMFIYTGALRSAKETERYIGGTKMSTTPAYRGGGLQLPGSADAASAAPTFGSTLLPSGWRCIVG